MFGFGQSILLQPNSASQPFIVKSTSNVYGYFSTTSLGGADLNFINSANGDGSTGTLAGKIETFIDHLGIKSSNSLTFSTNNSESMRINTAGNVGIGTLPLRKFHVMADGLSGATPLSTENFFFENHGTSYLGIAVPNASETGILFGKASSASSGGVIYSATNDMLLRTGGNNTRLLITSAGNVSIGTGAAPTEKLEINGTSKIGINGTQIIEIIKVTRSTNIASTPAGTESSVTFQIPNVQLGSTVYISPSLNLPDGLIIAHALCETPNTVEVKFFNASAVTVDPPSMDFYITVIR